MRQLEIVSPTELIYGETYLIQESSNYPHLKYKGVFVKNDYPEKSNYCVISHFTNVLCNSNQTRSDLSLQSNYWNYYKADAVVRAYTNWILRDITGDPYFCIKIIL